MKWRSVVWKVARWHDYQRMAVTADKQDGQPADGIINEKAGSGKSQQP